MRTLLIAVGISALAGGCAADMYLPMDLDEDGLLENEEQELGTDPTVADSDGDGHLDGAELNEGTDPLDFEDHPYLGGYEIDKDCRGSVVAQGNGIGEVTVNITGPDQFGETVDSYDFCGKYILLINALDT